MKAKIEVNSTAMTPAPFIVGVGRSGTTLLRLMLDAHPALAIPAETHFLSGVLALPPEQGDLDSFFRRVVASPTWPNFALESVEFRRALEEVEPFSIAGAIRRFYKLYAGKFGCDRWGDKTPPYRNLMVEIERLLPEARFIHMIRDGRDVALSYQGLWFGPGDDLELQARFWVAELQSARRQSAVLRHYLEVRYETLVSDPAAVLQQVCRFLDLPYHASMLDYHTSAAARLAEVTRAFAAPGTVLPDIARFLSIHARTHTAPDPTRIGRWRIEMPDAQQQMYEAIAGQLLRALDYDTRFTPPG